MDVALMIHNRSDEPSIQYSIYYPHDIDYFTQYGNTIVFSPSLKKWCKVNDIVHEFIKLVTQDKRGSITYNQIRKLIENSSDISMDSSHIHRFCKSIIKTGVFYQSEEAMCNAESRAFEKKHIPKDTILNTAYIHPTHRCNFNCSYCYNASLERSQNTELSTEQWCIALDQLRKIGVERVIFTGGEPFLRDDLAELLAYSNNLGNYTEVLTNGSLLTNDLIDEFSNYINRIIISLDSLDQSTQSKNRSSLGFETILDSISYLSESNGPKVSVRSVITRNNVSEIESLKESLETDYNVEHLSTIFLPNSLDEVDLMPADEFYSDDDKDYHHEIDGRKYIPGIIRCGACTQIVALDAHGDVFPCQNFIKYRNYRVCNIFENDWYNTLLNSELRERFRMLSVLEKEVCKECNLSFICGGGCPAISCHVYGNLNSHLPFLCDHLKEFSKERMILAARKIIPV